MTVAAAGDMVWSGCYRFFEYAVTAATAAAAAAAACQPLGLLVSALDLHPSNSLARPRSSLLVHILRPIRGARLVYSSHKPSAIDLPGLPYRQNV